MPKINLLENGNLTVGLSLISVEIKESNYEKARTIYPQIGEFYGRLYAFQVLIEQYFFFVSKVIGAKLNAQKFAPYLRFRFSRWLKRGGMNHGEK